MATFDLFMWDNPRSMRGQTVFHMPLPSPPFDNEDIAWSPSMRPIPMQFPITPPQQQSAASWALTPDSSQFSSFDPSTSFDGIDSPVWWGHAGTAPIAQPSPTPFHSDTRHATKSLAMRLQTDLKPADFHKPDLKHESNDTALCPGLLIQMPHSPIPQSCIISSDSNQDFLTASYPELQVSRRRHHTGPPPQSSPRMLRMPPNFRPNPNHPSHRRHRSSTDPMSSSHKFSSPHSQRSPSFKSSFSKHHTHRHSKSDLSHHRFASSTSSSSKSSAGETKIDFVNFTPSDSSKILTGVAPSGSSKTKARREKEAMEKRWRLSQAAMKAVRAAGGDVERLVKEDWFA